MMLVDQQFRAQQKSQRPLVIWLTDIDSPYEAPLNAEGLTVTESVNTLLAYLHEISALHSGYQAVELEEYSTNHRESSSK